MEPAPLSIRAGSITALWLFDIAYAIDLAKAESLWAAHTGSASSRSRLSATPAKALAFGEPPVALTLEPLSLDLDGERLTATLSARLYDFGVVALALRLPVADRDWPGFVDLCNALDRAAANPAIWEAALGRVRKPLAAALIRPTDSNLQEDYLVATVQQWSEPVAGSAVAQRVDLAPLLSGERRALSEAARRELLRQQFSYYEDDLVVLTWDRAFIYEPRGDSDVADVLEAANAQLLELRYYDELLDDELPRMYDLVEETRRSKRLLAPRRYANLARRLHTLVAKVTELTEKADNVLKVTEDVYLARVYGAALELLRVPSVGAAVDRKLAIIRDTYTALYDEASDARGTLLELAIVALIVVEIVLALLRR